MADMDYATDVTKYTANVNANAVAGIVKFCGIALQSKDASMVSCSSKSELERVRESFLKRKLKMTDADADLDKLIKGVCEQMKAEHNKARVTFYYLLAEKTGKLADL